MLKGMDTKHSKKSLMAKLRSSRTAGCRNKRRYKIVPMTTRFHGMPINMNMIRTMPTPVAMSLYWRSSLHICVVSSSRLKFEQASWKFISLIDTRYSCKLTDIPTNCFFFYIHSYSYIIICASIHGVVWGANCLEYLCM